MYQELIRNDYFILVVLSSIKLEWWALVFVKSASLLSVWVSNSDTVMTSLKKTLQCFASYFIIASTH